MGEARSLQYLVHGRLLVGDQPHPGHVEVGQRPGILESGAAAALCPPARRSCGWSRALATSATTYRQVEAACRSVSLLARTSAVFNFPTRLRRNTGSNGTWDWSRPVVLPTTLFLTPFLPALAPAFMTRAGAPLCPDGHVGQKSTVGICHGVSESLSAICSSRPSARALVSQALENG